MDIRIFKTYVVPLFVLYIVQEDLEEKLASAREESAKLTERLKVKPLPYCIVMYCIFYIAFVKVFYILAVLFPTYFNFFSFSTIANESGLYADSDSK